MKNESKHVKFILIIKHDKQSETITTYNYTTNNIAAARDVEFTETDEAGVKDANLQK